MIQSSLNNTGKVSGKILNTSSQKPSHSNRFKQTYLQNGVKKQRHKKVNKTFSSIHRYTGKNNYMINIDGFEVDGEGNSLALIESKLENETFSEFQRKAIKNLANKALLPAFEVRHDARGQMFTILPINKLAEEFMKHHGVPTESIHRRGFLNFIHAIHGTKPTEQEVEDFLNVQLTEDER